MEGPLKAFDGGGVMKELELGRSDKDADVKLLRSYQLFRSNQMSEVTNITPHLASIIGIVVTRIPLPLDMSSAYGRVARGFRLPRRLSMYRTENKMLVRIPY